MCCLTELRRELPQLFCSLLVRGRKNLHLISTLIRIVAVLPTACFQPPATPHEHESYPSLAYRDLTPSECFLPDASVDSRQSLPTNELLPSSLLLQAPCSTSVVYVFHSLIYLTVTSRNWVLFDSIRYQMVLVGQPAHRTKTGVKLLFHKPTIDVYYPIRPTWRPRGIRWKTFQNNFSKS